MRWWVAAVAGLALVAEPTSGMALPSDRASKLVAAARELVGMPYELGGRMRKPGEGIDCQGVLFYAAERIGRCNWKSFSVMPTKSVELQELGRRVPGLDPVASSSLDLSLLEPGDIIMLVGPEENPKESAIGRLGDSPVWVWHTGLYSGGGMWIEADIPTVIETDLAAYLVDYAEFYSGIFVTRMDAGPKAKTCRRHEPMKRPTAPTAEPPPTDATASPVR